MRASLKAVLFAPFVALGLGAFASACSLTNISRSDCGSDTDCVAAFGVGSTCKAGLCSEPAGCTTGHDCRALAGGGACVDGACVAKIPVDPQCNFPGHPPEPEDLFDRPLTGPDAPIIIGSVFALDTIREDALTKAARVAVREINQGGLNNGQQLGIVFCDNGGAGATVNGDDRFPLDQHAVDYLAGTLGVPYIVGPLTSKDAIQMVNQIKKQAYPTVLISPSATSPALTDIDDKLAPGQPGLFWRTCPSDEIQGTVLATKVIGPDTTIKRVSVFYIHDAYGDGLSKIFQDTYGIDAVDLFLYEDVTLTDQAAIDKIIDAADAKNNDAVLFIGHDGAAARLFLDSMGGKNIATKRFFFTDGTKAKDTLLAQPMPAHVQTILANAQGTAPASPSGPVYKAFDTLIQYYFSPLQADDYSFLAQTFDATFVGAFGTVWASRDGAKFNGVDVATGMTKLNGGMLVDLDGVNGWTTGKGVLLSSAGIIDIEGASGHLDFDNDTGEAPGAIEVWGIASDLSDFTEIMVVPP